MCYHRQLQKVAEEGAPAPAQPEAEMNGIDDTPAWYDPIYNR